jgi:hypothetical protein
MRTSVRRPLCRTPPASSSPSTTLRVPPTRRAHRFHYQGHCCAFFSRACRAASTESYPLSLGVSFILLVSPTMRLSMLLRRRVLLIVLLHHRLMGLVLVVLTVENRLLLRRGISRPRVLPLIGGHGRRAWNGRPRRLLPAMMLLLPASTPVLAPSRRRTCRPSPEVGRRPTVVPDGNAQEKVRNDLRIHRECILPLSLRRSASSRRPWPRSRPHRSSHRRAPCKGPPRPAAG